MTLRMPQETKIKETPQAAARTSLEGLAVTREDEKALLDALEKAFDYRGDVTITLTATSAMGALGGEGTTVAGYIFDRSRGATLGQSRVRLMVAPPDPRAGQKVAIPFSQIAGVEFTGKDAAHGKTFENWVRRFTETRLKGERAGIESERLD